MGRSSSTGYPFLVQRVDAGQFTYHRDVPVALAPLVVGDVLLSWSGRARKLEGKGTIKISLGTGDEKTARQRWGAVHPQVDALIQMAHLRMQSRSGTARSTDVPRLDTAHVRKIADQAYHDVLATDDRSQVVPGYVTELAGVLLHLSQGNVPISSNQAAIAALAARKIEEKLHHERIRRRTTWLLDQPIQESELNDGTLDAFPAELKKGDRLAPEQVEALARGIRIDEIPSEVEQRLKENGLDLPDGHVDRRALALAITRAKLRALKDVRRRDAGLPIDTPERPAVVHDAESTPSTPVPLLSAMHERWIGMVRPGDKQISDNARYVRLFIGVHGNLPVDQITGAHVRAFRDALLECPRNVPQHLAKAPIAELAAWAEANPTKPKLSRETINHKALGSVRSMLEQARKDEHIGSNPAQGQQLPTKAGDKQTRRSYTLDELKLVFSTHIYRPSPRIPAGGKGWSAWWLPLLSLYTGARLEELGQALIGDIRRRHDIDYLEVTIMSDDDENKAPDAGKSLKSDAARRRIPLHATLIQAGFLDYVAFVKATGAKRLFPELDEYRGRYTKNFSRWWGRWLSKLGMTDASINFHSFRHTFVAELRRLRCDHRIMKEIVGHAQTDVTSGYGRKEGWLYELGDLNEQIQRMTFNVLDLDHLIGLKSWQ